MSEDEEIVQAFLDESRENLDTLDRDLVDLEAHPDDPALLGRVFRTVHTIKGTCGFLGYRRLEALTHAGETLLGALRSGEVVADAAVTTSLLRLMDAVRRVLAGVEAEGAEGDEDHGPLIAELRAHVTETAPEASPTVGATPAPAAAGGASGAAPETSVRVDVTLLDKLLELVGELVLARGRIGEVAGGDEEGPLAEPYRQLRLVTGELQEHVMRARLQPVGTVTGKFRRIGRDLATALGKRVRVEVEGEDVAVDKAVNEALRDPLLHLVRNAMDHGIESPEERVAAGKAAEGRIRMRARQEGGRVQVEVGDDGRGIDAGRLVAQSLASGLLTSEQAERMTGDDALELIFRPGVTTKAEVTNLSGRGVGMDVVRANLEQVGGSIAVSSDPGRGTVFRINVPLTLAILPGLVVSCGGARYVLPRPDVEEVAVLGEEEVAASVHEVGDAWFHRRRGRLVPLVRLAGELGGPAGPLVGPLHVVVVSSEGHRFGLVVDEIGDTTDTVVKPLTRATRAVPLFAGVTILGDGRPSLILDVAALADHAGVKAFEEEAAGTPEAPTATTDETTAELLVARGADGGRLAVPINMVRRLERFAVEQVERTGAMEVVQYGEVLLPLVHVADHLPAGRGPGRPAYDADGLLDAIVCDSSAGPVGLVVDGIVDVAPAPVAAPAQPPSRRGVTRRVVVAERVTELLDLELLVAEAGLGTSA